MGIPDEGQLVELQLPEGDVVRGRKINGRWIKDGDLPHAPGLQIAAWRPIEKQRAPGTKRVKAPRKTARKSARRRK